MHIKEKRLYRVLISFVTLCAFFSNMVFYDLAWGANATNPAVSAGNISTAPLDINGISIPFRFGEIKDTFKGSNGKTIIHIQDAHCNYSAQHASEAIIKHLVSTYNIGLVSLEGGKGNYDLSIFTKIKDPELRKKVSDYFVKEGRISGPEFFAINNPDKVKLFGIEDEKLYGENLNAYRSSLIYKEEVDKYLNTLSLAITNLKLKAYSPELKEVDEKIKAYKDSKIDFKAYIAFLKEKAELQKVDINTYPNLSSLLTILNDEKSINFKNADTERSILIDKLNQKLSTKDLEELVVKSVQFKQGDITNEEFYSYLLKKARFTGVDFSKLPNLVKYSEYVKKYDAIDKLVLYKEIAKLETTLVENLAKTDDQKTIYSLDKDLSLIKGMFNIALIKEDFDYYVANKANFSVKRFTDFINKKAPIYGLSFKLDDGIAKLDSYRDSMEKFYVYSQKRDDAFIKNIANKFKAEKKDVTILVTGGFHTGNLSKLLKNKGYSYIEVMPKFEKTDIENPYFKILSGGKSHIETIVESRISNIAVPQVLSEMGIVGARDRNIFALSADIISALEANPKKGILLMVPGGYLRLTHEPQTGSFNEKVGEIAGKSLYAVREGNETYDPSFENIIIFDHKLWPREDCPGHQAMWDLLLKMAHTPNETYDGLEAHLLADFLAPDLSKALEAKIGKENVAKLIEIGNKPFGASKGLIHVVTGKDKSVIPWRIASFSRGYGVNVTYTGDNNEFIDYLLHELNAATYYLETGTEIQHANNDPEVSQVKVGEILAKIEKGLTRGDSATGEMPTEQTQPGLPEEASRLANRQRLVQAIADDLIANYLDSRLSGKDSLMPVIEEAGYRLSDYVNKVVAYVLEIGQLPTTRDLNNIHATNAESMAAHPDISFRLDVFMHLEAIDIVNQTMQDGESVLVQKMKQGKKWLRAHVPGSTGSINMSNPNQLEIREDIFNRIYNTGFNKNFDGFSEGMKNEIRNRIETIATTRGDSTTGRMPPDAGQSSESVKDTTAVTKGRIRNLVSIGYDIIRQFEPPTYFETRAGNVYSTLWNMLENLNHAVQSATTQEDWNRIKETLASDKEKRDSDITMLSRRNLSSTSTYEYGERNKLRARLLDIFDKVSAETEKMITGKPVRGDSATGKMPNKPDTEVTSLPRNGLVPFIQFYNYYLMNPALSPIVLNSDKIADMLDVPEPDRDAFRAWLSLFTHRTESFWSAHPLGYLPAASDVQDIAYGMIHGYDARPRGDSATGEMPKNATIAENPTILTKIFEILRIKAPEILGRRKYKILPDDERAILWSRGNDRMISAITTSPGDAHPIDDYTFERQHSRFAHQLDITLTNGETIAFEEGARVADHEKHVISFGPEQTQVFRTPMSGELLRWVVNYVYKGPNPLICLGFDKDNEICAVVKDDFYQDYNKKEKGSPHVGALRWPLPIRLISETDTERISGLTLISPQTESIAESTLVNPPEKVIYQRLLDVQNSHLVQTLSEVTEVEPILTMSDLLNKGVSDRNSISLRNVLEAIAWRSGSVRPQNSRVTKDAAGNVVKISVFFTLDSDRGTIVKELIFSRVNTSNQWEVSAGPTTQDFSLLARNDNTFWTSDLKLVPEGALIIAGTPTSDTKIRGDSATGEMPKNISPELAEQLKSARFISQGALNPPVEIAGSMPLATSPTDRRELIDYANRLADTLRARNFHESFWNTNFSNQSAQELSAWVAKANRLIREDDERRATRGDSATGEMPDTVILKNGAFAYRDGINAVMVALQHLLESRPELFVELVRKARNPDHKIWGGAENENHLKILNMLQSNGQLHDLTRNILLSAIEGEGLNMRLVSPIKFTSTLTTMKSDNKLPSSQDAKTPSQLAERIKNTDINAQAHPRDSWIIAECSLNGLREQMLSVHELTNRLPPDTDLSNISGEAIVRWLVQHEILMPHKSSELPERKPVVASKDGLEQYNTWMASKAPITIQWNDHYTGQPKQATGTIRLITPGPASLIWLTGEQFGIYISDITNASPARGDSATGEMPEDILSGWENTEIALLIGAIRYVSNQQHGLRILYETFHEKQWRERNEIEARNIIDSYVSERIDARAMEEALISFRTIADRVKGSGQQSLSGTSTVGTQMFPYSMVRTIMNRLESLKEQRGQQDSSRVSDTQRPRIKFKKIERGDSATGEMPVIPVSVVSNALGQKAVQIQGLEIANASDSWSGWIDIMRAIDQEIKNRCEKQIFDGAPGMINIPISEEFADQVFEAYQRYAAQPKNEVSRLIIRCNLSNNITVNLFRDTPEGRQALIVSVQKEIPDKDTQQKRVITFAYQKEGDKRDGKLESASYVVYMTGEIGKTATPVGTCGMTGLEFLNRSDLMARSTIDISKINESTERFIRGIAAIAGSASYEVLLDELAKMDASGIRQLLATGLILIRIRPIDTKEIVEFHERDAAVLKSL
ncbi:MAG: hypothetical protein WC522_06740 [Candidatus Omnitrophota bacterium]